MNARMKDALDETLMLSDKSVVLHDLFGECDILKDESRTIQDLVSQILLDVGALYKASEAVTPFISLTYAIFLMEFPIKVATLDMLWAFAHVSISESTSFELSLSQPTTFVKCVITVSSSQKREREKPVTEVSIDSST
jgi:hypothetical protein